MRMQERPSQDPAIEALKEKRRQAAERVRHRLQQLEEAERAFNSATEELADATQRLRRDQAPQTSL
jgi:prefoldin subunit 5